ncbi:MAG TPA: hypothetical protein PLF89_02985 [bacterium]|nr:hypothetical protein [bacterium]
MENRILKPGRTVTARLIKRSKDDRSFDIAFWQAQGGMAIFAAAWQMVNEVRAFRGQDGAEPRLLRSVETIERRQG